jgi:hypothetical protein
MRLKKNAVGAAREATGLGIAGRSPGAGHIFETADGLATYGGGYTAQCHADNAPHHQLRSVWSSGAGSEGLLVR